MRHILLSIILSATAAGTAAAQTWPLDSCISYAVSNNIDVQRSRANARSAELDVTEAKDKFLPTVSAGASQGWNFGRGLTSENIYANRNTSQTGWNVGAELPLFQGLAAKRRLDLSRVNLSRMLTDIDRAEDDVTLNVISAYLQVLYNREIVTVAELQRDLSADEVKRRRELVDAGRIPELDLLQAESQLAQDESTLVSARNDADMALTELRLLLRLPHGAAFDVHPLDGTVDDIIIPDAATVYANAMANLPAVAAARMAITVADRQEALARTGYMPTLSFSASAGSSYYSISGMPNASFASQMRDNFNTYVGFTLRIPVFDAFSTRNAGRRARLQRLTAQLDLEDTEHNLDRAITQAWQKATSARSQYASGTVAEEATRAAFEAMQTKYEYGRANATEYDQAKTSYIKARAEQVRNRYELLLRCRILDFYNRH